MEEDDGMDLDESAFGEEEEEGGDRSAEVEDHAAAAGDEALGAVPAPEAEGDDLEPVSDEEQDEDFVVPDVKGWGNVVERAVTGYLLKCRQEEVPLRVAKSRPESDRLFMKMKKGFKCDTCDERFAFKSGLQAHKNRCDSGSNMRSKIYQPKESVASTGTTLFIMNNMRHNVVEQKEDGRLVLEQMVVGEYRHICMFCKFKSRHASNINIHMKTCSSKHEAYDVRKKVQAAKIKENALVKEKKIQKCKYCPRMLGEKSIKRHETTSCNANPEVVAKKKFDMENPIYQEAKVARLEERKRANAVMRRSAKKQKK